MRRSTRHGPADRPAARAGEERLLHQIVAKLEAAPNDPRRARAFGRMAFIEWLEGLPGAANFPLAALDAFDATREVARRKRAAAVFRGLLVEATRRPLRPLGLTLPEPHRRGGQRNRRLRQ